MRSLIAAAGVVLLVPVAAYQDVALKDLMPKGMVVGVALNQRQFGGTDTAAVEIVTRQFNQISRRASCASTASATRGIGGWTRRRSTSRPRWSSCTAPA